MGLSSTTSKSKTDESRTENATTIPVNPPWVTGAIEQYTGRLGTFGDSDPYSFVAGPAPLQQTAWQNAGTLADWQPQARLASEQALEAANAAPIRTGTAQAWTPATATATGFDAPTPGAAPRS